MIGDGQKELLENMVPVQVVAPNGEEVQYARDALVTRLVEVRETVLTELYGEPISDKSRELRSLSKAALDAAEKRPSEIGLEGDYCQWVHFAEELEGGGWITVRLLRHFGSRYDYSTSPATFVPANDNDYSSDMKVTRYRVGGGRLQEEELNIWLESVEDGVEREQRPSVNIQPVGREGGWVDPQDYFYESVTRVVGQEKTAWLKQMGRGEPETADEALSRSVRAVVNVLMFGDEEERLELFPSIHMLPAVGVSRGLRQKEEEMVDLAVGMMRRGSVDKSDNQFWGEKTLGWIHRTDGLVDDKIDHDQSGRIKIGFWFGQN